ncbi:MAG: response regulator [Anaerolineae bacterium]|nr:response regulator [Anaerolineae bacterium]
MGKRSQADLLQELRQTFRVEAQEHLHTLNQALLDLERTEAADRRAAHVQNAFRAAHSLKGAARAVNMPAIETLAHAMESLLQQARDAGRVLDAATCDHLYAALDTISDVLADRPVSEAVLAERQSALSGGPATPAAPVPSPTTAPATATATPTATATATPAAASLPADDTIRVSIRRLDQLMARMGELLVARMSLTRSLESLPAQREALARWQQTLQGLRGGLLPAGAAGVAGAALHNLLEQQARQAQALSAGFEALEQHLHRENSRLTTIADELQEQVRYLRMIPFQTIALPLERTVRDLSHSENKPITFIISGGEVELDRKVLETLKDPLLHLLRNAIDHGIETPEERRAAGKAPHGSITLTVQQRGSEIRLTVRDDGRGFDFEQLGQVYRRQRGDAPLGDLSRDELIEMAFHPGITTSHQVTALSGRGVGLDIVRKELEVLQGRVRVDSQPGAGTTLELIVPTSLTMTRGLLVQVGAETFALPLHAIEKIAPVERVVYLSGQPMLELGTALLPLYALAALLERAPQEQPPAGTRAALVIGAAEQRVALLVDDILTEQELAVKPLSHPLKRVRNVTGTALPGSGEPIIVLNPSDLVRSARGRQPGPAPALDGHLPAPAAPEPAPVAVLVVDDSITTRTLEKNILEAAGFLVTTAINGVEALRRLREKPVDVVVSDVQMPEMDGLELVRQIRSSEYRHLPVILVTSLESAHDREQGLKAGADAYIVKRGFDQAELLTTVARLVGRALP